MARIRCGPGGPVSLKLNFPEASALVLPATSMPLVRFIRITSSPVAGLLVVPLVTVPESVCSVVWAAAEKGRLNSSTMMRATREFAGFKYTPIFIPNFFLERLPSFARLDGRDAHRSSVRLMTRERLRIVPTAQSPTLLRRLPLPMMRAWIDSLRQALCRLYIRNSDHEGFRRRLPCARGDSPGASFLLRRRPRRGRRRCSRGRLE